MITERQYLELVMINLMMSSSILDSRSAKKETNLDLPVKVNQLLNNLASLNLYRGNIF